MLPLLKKTEGKAEKDDIVNIDYCELDADGNEVEGRQKEKTFVFTIGSWLYNVYQA